MRFLDRLRPVIARARRPSEGDNTTEPPVTVPVPGEGERVPHDLLVPVPDVQQRRWLRAMEMPATEHRPWLDRPDSQQLIDERLDRGELTATQADLCTQFSERGFAVVPNLFSTSDLDRVWDAFERAAADGTIVPAPEQKGDEDRIIGHVMNAHLTIPEIWEMFSHPSLIEVVELLLGIEPVPFQTLLFPKGREQLAHSDTIHMTTFPLGYMCAAWIALEDISPGSGPLQYFPGSHRLDRVFSHDIDMTPEEFAQREYAAIAERYEPRIQQLIAEQGLEPEFFLPKAGDVLIWHENLLHGGSPRTDLSVTRKSLVGHYFGKGTLCYHDASGKMADRIYDGAPSFPRLPIAT